MTDRATVSPPKPESKMPMGALGSPWPVSARTTSTARCSGGPHAGHSGPRHPRSRSRPRPGDGHLGPELALEAVLGLVDGAFVGAGGEVLPAAVADDEGDVGALARLDR